MAAGSQTETVVKFQMNALIKRESFSECGSICFANFPYVSRHCSRELVTGVRCEAFACKNVTLS